MPNPDQDNAYEATTTHTAVSATADGVAFRPPIEGTARRRSDCVDLLDRTPGTVTFDGPVVLLSRCETRGPRFEQWRSWLNRHGIEAQWADEVAACAL